MLTLVTGATGLVGNNVVRWLLDRGEAVRVLEREGSDPRPLKGLDVERARGDIRNAEAVRQACRGVGRIVHAAAYVHIGWSGEELHRAINVTGTKNAIAGALEAGARMVHVSTVDTLGLGNRNQPANEETLPDSRIRCPYVVTKRAAEKAVLDAVKRGLDAVIVNPTYMLGPWDWKPSSGRMLLHIARGRQLLAPRGGNDFSDVRDVVAGIYAAANRGQRGRRYILGGEPMSYLAVWRLFAEVAGVRGPICRSGPVNIMIAGWAGDVWHLVTGHEPDLNSASTKLSAQHHHFSYRRATDELGYAPRSAREAVQAAWDWFCEHGYCPTRPMLATTA